MTSLYLKALVKETGKSEDELSLVWNKAKQVTTETFGIQEKDFGKKEYRYAQEIARSLLKINEDTINPIDFLNYKGKAIDFIETLVSGSFPSLNKDIHKKKKKKKKKYVVQVQEQDKETDKEREKQDKEREKEKQAREKEKERQDKEREKERERIAKEKEKERIAREKEQEKELQAKKAANRAKSATSVNEIMKVKKIFIKENKYGDEEIIEEKVEIIQ